MILIDKAGHMVSDKSIAELHAFALGLTLPRRYFRGTQRGHPHYDLTSRDKRESAIVAGAHYVTTRNIVRRMVR